MCSSRNSFCFFQKKIFVYVFVFIYARGRWRCTGIGTPTHTLGGTLDLTSIVGKAHSAPSHHATRAFTHPHSSARIRSHERSRKAMRTLVPTGVKARTKGQGRKETRIGESVRKMKRHRENRAEKERSPGKPGRGRDAKTGPSHKRTFFKPNRNGKTPETGLYARSPAFSARFFPCGVVQIYGLPRPAHRGIRSTRDCPARKTVRILRGRHPRRAIRQRRAPHLPYLLCR